MKRNHHSKVPAKHFSARGALGVMATFVLPLLLALRWGELTESLTKLHVADRPIELAIFGWFHFASTCTATGAALTVAAMIAASVFKLESSSQEPCPYLRTLAGSGWIVLAAMELFLSVQCTSGPWPGQLAACGIALATLLFETMAAILVIEHTIPEALAMLSSALATLSGLFAGPREPDSDTRTRHPRRLRGHKALQPVTSIFKNLR